MPPDPGTAIPDVPLVLLGIALATSLQEAARTEAQWIVLFTTKTTLVSAVLRPAECQPELPLCTQTTVSPSLAATLIARVVLRPGVAR